MQEKILTIRSVVLLLGLAFCGLEDYRKKEIHLLPVLLMSVVGALLSVLGKDWTDWTIICRFAPGMLLFLLAWFTKESIGYGDAWVLLGLGCFLSAIEILNLSMIAISVAGLVALFLLLVKRKGRKTRIPFVPFLLVGYVALLMV